MNHSVAAVEAEIPDQDQASPPAADQAFAGPGSRFTYPSGAQPLAGYTIKRGVGHGGFGEVYYAMSDAGKEVAIKLIRRNLDVELRGIRHCLNLKHPNLLSVFDIREDAQGDNWVVMEFVAGRALDDVVAANPTGMPIERALFWIHGIGAGVSHLHDHGVVHRDLKPGNIFNDQGMVKIGDYGLSKFISCSRRSGQTESIGTVHYMAPEVANGRYGKEIDVYALGIVLYEMLTGRVPFEGESVGEVLMKHLTAPPDVSMLSEPYRSVVAKALEKDPVKRYGSAGEMLADLPKPQHVADYGPAPTAGSATSYDSPGSRPKSANGAASAAASRPTPEEPIYRALRDGYQDVRRNWNHSNLNTPTKVALLVMLLVAAPFMLGSFSSLAIFLVGLYCVYWIIRALILTVKEPAPVGPPPPPTHPSRARPVVPPNQGQAPAARSVRTRQSRLPRWARREKSVSAMLVKPLRQRLTELVGSMLAGAVIAILVCVLGFVLASLRSDAVVGPVDLARYGWVILASVIGTWAVLVPAKFWEGYKGDVKLRRFTMMLAGLVVGLFVAAISAGLLVDLPNNELIDFELNDMTGLEPVRLTSANVLSDLRYYLVGFGALFLLLRWWRSADPMRTARLSLFAVFVSGLFAAMISNALGFPQPWLVMVACAMSVSVQLASPWIHPRLRASQDDYD
jgi:eukaryotic-like serine/threonine-protein kinase